MKRSTIGLGLSFVFILSAFIFISCRKQPSPPPQQELADEPALPAEPYDYYSKNKINNHMATLGRVLFYDRKLSVNNAVSCGSCHKQEFAFADNVQFNKGFNGVPLKRNSPSIQGIRGFITQMQPTFVNGQWISEPMQDRPTRDNQSPELLFWDGRQTSVADMVLNPVLNHNEMNIPDFESLITKLKSIDYYAPLFKNAFGDENINTERLALALQSFIACLNTDKPKNFGMQHVAFSGGFGPGIPRSAPSPTNLVEMGRFLFHAKYNCAKCHDPSHGGGYGNAVSPSQMFNIGLDEEINDRGLGEITGKPGDMGLFKVPTLQNISLTAPYMHDGRFANLGEVIDHYSHGIKSNPNLSPDFKATDGRAKNLNISPVEKNALIVFLNTLKDEDFLTSPLYADPFKK